MSQDYDPNVDVLRSWQLAISELRKRGLREGRFEPESDEERAFIEEKRDDQSGQTVGGRGLGEAS